MRIDYDNTISWLTATKVKEAIDELASGWSGWSNPIYEIQIAWEQTTWLIWRFISKWTQTLAWCKISLSQLPTWSNFSVDIRKNWILTTNSIFTSDTPISILTSTSATNWIYTVTSTAIDNWSLVENDVIWIYITQIGSTLSWIGLEVICY